MGENSAQLHEDASSLRPETIERHRAVASLMEELEAIVGRVDTIEAADGLEASRRRVQPVVELRTPFELSRAELDSVDRGAADPDLAALIEAARRAALAEDRAVFHGYAPGGIAGMS